MELKGRSFLTLKDFSSEEEFSLGNTSPLQEVLQASKAFNTESCRVSPPSTKTGSMPSCSKSFSTFLLENKAFFPSIILSFGQVITTEANLKKGETLESRKVFKKPMQDKDKTVLLSLSCTEIYSFFVPVPKRVEEPAAVIIK